MTKINLKDIYTGGPGKVNWLVDRTIFATVHGSRAYGTNTETSDTDIKGVCVAPQEYQLGFINVFEQAIQTDPTDLVIYDIKKFFKLASDCNPNIIEVLFTDESDHIHTTSVGKILLENKNFFISKKARYTFSGYAISQLKRIKGHYQWITNPPKKPLTRQDFGLPERSVIPADQLAAAQAEINKKLDSWNLDFLGDYSHDVRIAIMNNVSDLLTEMKISKDDDIWVGAARVLGYSDNFIEILDKERQYKSSKDIWNQYQNWLNTRNPERAKLEEKYGYDCKHAYHLVRLMRMAQEILTTGEVIVKRPDREELLAIRNGAWSYQKLLEWAEEQDKKLQVIYETSTIVPHTPNKVKLDQLCISIIEQML